MSGCGVSCVPSHNIQNITKYAAPNKEISWDRAGMLCSNSALGYLSGGHLITWSQTRMKKTHLMTLTSQDKQFISTHHCKVFILTSVGVTDQCQCQNVLKASFHPSISVQQAVASVQWWATERCCGESLVLPAQQQHHHTSCVTSPWPSLTLANMATRAYIAENMPEWMMYESRAWQTLDRFSSTVTELYSQCSGNSNWFLSIVSQKRNPLFEWNEMI